MSPFRRRKRREEVDLRLRARRARLAERERQAYERERAEAASEPEITEPAYEAETNEPVYEDERTEAVPKRARRRRIGRRRARRPRRRRARPSLGALRSASASGARATVRQARPGVRRLGGGIGRALGWLLAWPLRLAALLERALTGLLRTVVALGARALAIAERSATPQRVLVLVTGGAAACLIYSQFVAYRGVEVGQPQYSEVSTVVRPDQVERVDAGAAHAYVLIPLAGLALAIAVFALLSGRWRLGRLVSAIGLVGIAISLAIDLPKGLDAGSAGVSFAGANATMTEGFYAQLAASAVLVLCGWVLAMNLRPRTGAAERRRKGRRRHPRPRRAPSVAGGGA